jgi:hypothetical protein
MSTGIATGAGAPPVTSDFEIYPIPVMQTTGAAVLETYNNTTALEGSMWYLPLRTTFNRIQFRTGSGWEGANTTRMCIYASADGSIKASLNRVVNVVIDNSLISNTTTEEITVAETTLQSGYYLIGFGRDTGTASIQIESWTQNTATIHTTDRLGVPTVFNAGISSTAPPATLDPTTLTPEPAEELLPVHKFRMV